MTDIIIWILLLVLIAGLIVAGVWYYKNYMSDGSGSPGLFGARAEKRLGVVEQSVIDGRRKLVLVHRDGVEHLIMTGGPVDVVIETGIGEGRSAAAPAEPPEPSTPVFSRAPRSLGQAAGE